MTLTPIGHVRSPRADLKDDHWGSVLSRIELVESLPSESLDGIEQFSHVEVVYFFDRVPDAEIERGSRAPARQHRLAEGRHLRPTRQRQTKPHRDHNRRAGLPRAAYSQSKVSTPSTARRCSTSSR